MTQLYDEAASAPPATPNPADLSSARCWGCGYLLTGLDRNRCPECGKEFDPSKPETMNLGRPAPAWGRALIQPLDPISPVFAVVATDFPFQLVVFFARPHMDRVARHLYTEVPMLDPPDVVLAGPYLTTQVEFEGASTIVLTLWTKDRIRYAVTRIERDGMLEGHWYLPEYRW